MGKGPSSFNLVSITLALVFGSGLYLSYKYVPIVWNKAKLQDIVKEVSFGAPRSSDEQVRKALIDVAKGDHGIILQDNDIEIVRYTDRIRIRVVWRPVIQFLWGRSVQHAIEVTESTTFY
jgi:hypothetical protein